MKGPKIGALVVAMGHASAEEVVAALIHQIASPDQPLGEILVERRVLSAADLQTLLELQAGWDCADVESRWLVASLPDEISQFKKTDS